MRTMSITVTDEVYELMKKTVPPRGMSKFINDLVYRVLSDHLRQTSDDYTDAENDPHRRFELQDWDKIIFAGSQD
jgi:hypothetical protein